MENIEEQILTLVKNHKKASMGGLVHYLNMSYEIIEAACKHLEENGLLKIYIRADGLIGVRLVKEQMWKQLDLGL